MPVIFPRQGSSVCFSSWPNGGGSYTSGAYGTVIGQTSGTNWTASPGLYTNISFQLLPQPQFHSLFYRNYTTSTPFIIGEIVTISGTQEAYIPGQYRITAKTNATFSNIYGPFSVVLHRIECLQSNQPSNNTIYDYINQPTSNATFSKSWIYSATNNTWNSLGLPVGSVIAYSGFSAPNGWALCDGTQYSTTTYQALYNSLSIQLTATLKSSNVLSQVSSLAGLYVGMPIRGSFYTNGGTITNLGNNTTDGNFIVLSSNLTGGLGTVGSFFALPFGFTSTTTFSVPDFRSKTQIGSGTGNGLTIRNTGVTGGEETNAINSLTMASHNHSINQTAHSHSGSTQVESNTHYHASSMRYSGQEAGGYGLVGSALFGNRVIVTGNPWDYPGFQPASAQHTHSFSTNNNVLSNTNIGTAGSSNSHNNMQPFLPLNYIIKY